MNFKLMMVFVLAGTFTAPVAMAYAGGSAEQKPELIAAEEDRKDKKEKPKPEFVAQEDKTEKPKPEPKPKPEFAAASDDRHDSRA